MRHRIRCEELGFDCMRDLEGESTDEVLEALTRHIETEHDGDWFDLEVVYEAARERMTKTAA